MVRDAVKPSWEMIRAATKELLTENSGGSWGDFKSGVATKLNVPVECLKPWKTKMKQVVAEGVKDGHSSDQEEDEGCSSDSGEENRGEESGEDDSSTEQYSSKACVGKGDKGSAAMRALKQMSRAMNLGPTPFQGLKDMGKRDAEKELTRRLINAGAEFKGPFPSSREISQAQRKTDKAKDLEGIDMGNVVQGSRRRGRPDGIAPPSKKRRRDDAHVGSSDNEGSQGTGSGRGEDSSDNEDSEAEFELSE